MFRFMLLAVVLVVAMGHPMEPCGRLMHGGMKCCKKEIAKPMPDEDFKECLQLPKKPASCEIDICIAKKKGVASDDGTIDKKALTEHIEQSFESEPTFADDVKNNCINKDISGYGMPDFCDLKKFKICMDVQFVKQCDSWSDEGDCSGMKDIANECIKKLSP